MKQKLILALSLFALAACTTQAQQSQTGITTSAEFKEAKSAATVSSAAASATSGIAIAQRLQSGGILQIGDAHAKVSMLLFINHNSDYSQRFMQTLLPWLMDDFVSKGTLQIGIVPVAFQKYPQSQTSAAMMLCATIQGKGRAMNDLLFTQVDPATIQKQIAAMGLNGKQLQDCLISDHVKQLIVDEAALAQAFTVTLVPSYTINGTMYTGLPEYADLKGQIVEAMK